MDYATGGWRSSPYCKTINGSLGIDVDELYGFQCKDFVDGYSRSLGAPFTSGNAFVLWYEPQPGWVKVGSPQPGDVFYRDAVFSGLDYGDTGIVTGVTQAGINVVQQNLAANLYVGSPPAVNFWPFEAIKGYLRKESMEKITKDQENVQSLLATGYYPGKDYNYRFVGTTDFDGLVNFWLQISQTQGLIFQSTQPPAGFNKYVGPELFTETN